MEMKHCFRLLSSGKLLQGSSPRTKWRSVAPRLSKPPERAFHRNRGRVGEYRPGIGAKFQNPLAAYCFQMEGIDSHDLATPVPPAFNGAQAAGEMVELYWQALARDTPFTDYATSPITQELLDNLRS